MRPMIWTTGLLLFTAPFCFLFETPQLLKHWFPLFTLLTPNGGALPCSSPPSFPPAFWNQLPRKPSSSRLSPRQRSFSETLKPRQPSWGILTQLRQGNLLRGSLELVGLPAAKNRPSSLRQHEQGWNQSALRLFW